MKIHDVFHVSLLELYTKINDSNVSTSLSIVVKGEDEYEVKEIFDSQIHQRKLQYLVNWIWYSYNKDQWVVKDNIAGLSELTKMFHKVYSQKPTSKDKLSQWEHKQRYLR